MLTDGFSKDNIEIPIQYMPQHLDPSLVNDTNGQFILNNLADGLLGWSFENGISPEISSSWKEVKKGTLIFTLRSNLKDFNGEEFSCKQIAEILKSHKKVNGPFISFYKKLKNIKCINPTLLLIESSFSTKELLAFLSGPAGKIIKINNYHIEKGIASFNIKLINNSLRLTKNKNYYNSEKIYFNNVSLVVLEDKVAVDKFINKGIDLILLSNLTRFFKANLILSSLASATPFLGLFSSISLILIKA